jgi:hypothetical protein
MNETKPLVFYANRNCPYAQARRHSPMKPDLTEETNWANEELTYEDF